MNTEDETFSDDMEKLKIQEEEGKKEDSDEKFLAPASDWIELNVGGRLFSTTRQTLTSHPDSMLCRMFSQQYLKSSKMKNDAYLLDRSPIYFDFILNYLRTGQLIFDHNINPEGILTEARYYGLEDLARELESIVSINIEDPPLTRQDVIKALIQVSLNESSFIHFAESSWKSPIFRLPIKLN